MVVGPFEVGCGKTLKGGRDFFLVLSDMSWEMGLRLGFDMICSVGIIL